MTRTAFARLKQQLVAAVNGKGAVPEAGRLVWGWFCDLSNGRSYHMAGPNPIAFADIEAFARLHRWPIKPHHVELIRAMDDAWIRKSLGTQTNINRARPATQQPITAEAFDAIFG
jgi:hypothetical protein